MYLHFFRQLRLLEAVDFTKDADDFVKWPMSQLLFVQPALRSRSGPLRDSSLRAQPIFRQTVLGIFSLHQSINTFIMNSTFNFHRGQWDLLYKLHRCDELI